MPNTSTLIDQTVTPRSDNAELSNVADVLRIFKLSKKDVIFSWHQDQLQVLVKENNDCAILDLENVEGLPKEVLRDRKKAEAYLRNCNLTIPKYIGDVGFTVRLSLNGLKGGGNIGEEIEYWPLEEENGRYKFVIPYKLKASPDAASIANGEKSAYVQALQQEMVNGTETGKRIEKELDSIAAMREAIRRWNATGLVKLVPFDTVSPLPKRWIKLTTNPDGVCQSKCIGRCPAEGEHTITCDLEGDFRTHKLRSVMHEIGHAVGLRHEHARIGRDQVLYTNFPELGGIPVGPFDFGSIMHYQFGRFKNGKYLFLNETMLKILDPKALEAWQRLVGKTPVISEGDKAAVKKLIENAKKAKAEKEAAEIAALLQRLAALHAPSPSSDTDCSEDWNFEDSSSASSSSPTLGFSDSFGAAGNARYSSSAHSRAVGRSEDVSSEETGTMRRSSRRSMFRNGE